MELKDLVRHVPAYGVSDAVNRSTGFLLVPLYTRVLSREDYGALALLYSVLAFAGVLYTLGMSGAFLREFTPAGEVERREVFSTALWLLGGCGLALSATLWALCGRISAVLGQTVFRNY